MMPLSEQRVIYAIMRKQGSEMTDTDIKVKWPKDLNDL